MEKTENTLQSGFSSRIKSTLEETRFFLKEQRVFFVMTLVSLVFSCFDIYSLDSKFSDSWKNVFEELSLAAVTGSLFTLFAAFYVQKAGALKKYIIQSAVSLCGFALGFFSKRGFGNSLYGDLYFWGITLSLIPVMIFIFIPKKNAPCYFSNLLKHVLFSFFTSGILFCALSLLIAAFQNLIFDFGDFEIYECTASLCFTVFFLNVCAYYLFYRRNENTSGKAFRVVFLYILFPVFIILLFLLYVYLFKALVLLKLPEGEINWFVSFASCIYIVFYFVLREYSELVLIRVFYKALSFVFIPLVALQIAAYVIRFNAYGFTGWRFSSLLFIIFSVITIVLTFIKKGEFTEYALPVLAALILFGSVTPFNLIDSAYKSQFSRMMSVLNKYGMYDENTASLSSYEREKVNQIISDEDRECLSSSFDYLTRKNKVLLPLWMTPEENKKTDFKELFGIDSYSENENLFYADYNNSSVKAIDIKNFSSMKEISSSRSSWKEKDGKYQYYADEFDRITLEVDGNVFDVTDFIFSDPGSEPDRNSDEWLFYELDENKVLYVTRYDFCWNEENKLFRDYSLKGYVFYK